MEGRWVEDGEQQTFTITLQLPSHPQSENEKEIQYSLRVPDRNDIEAGLVTQHPIQMINQCIILKNNILHKTPLDTTIINIEDGKVDWSSDQSHILIPIVDDSSIAGYDEKLLEKVKPKGTQTVLVNLNKTFLNLDKNLSNHKIDAPIDCTNDVYKTPETVWRQEAGNSNYLSSYANFVKNEYYWSNDKRVWDDSEPIADLKDTKTQFSSFPFNGKLHSWHTENSKLQESAALLNDKEIEVLPDGVLPVDILGANGEIVRCQIADKQLLTTKVDPQTAINIFDYLPESAFDMQGAIPKLKNYQSVGKILAESTKREKGKMLNSLDTDVEFAKFNSSEKTLIPVSCQAQSGFPTSVIYSGPIATASILQEPATVESIGLKVKPDVMKELPVLAESSENNVTNVDLSNFEESILRCAEAICLLGDTSRDISDAHSGLPEKSLPLKKKAKMKGMATFGSIDNKDDASTSVQVVSDSQKPDRICPYQRYTRSSLKGWSGSQPKDNLKTKKIETQRNKSTVINTLSSTKKSKSSNLEKDTTYKETPNVVETTNTKCSEKNTTDQKPSTDSSRKVKTLLKAQKTKQTGIKGDVKMVSVDEKIKPKVVRTRKTKMQTFSSMSEPLSDLKALVPKPNCRNKVTQCSHTPNSRQSYNTIRSLLEDMVEKKLLSKCGSDLIISGLYLLKDDILKEMNDKCGLPASFSLPYSSSLKSFAFMINFDNPIGHCYVGKIFGNGWPSLEELKKWKSAANASRTGIVH